MIIVVAWQVKWSALLCFTDLYQEVVKELRKPNISFSDLHSMQNTNQQSGYFKLEEHVKSMKRMAPKGNITAEIWQHIAWSYDIVNNGVDHAMDLLNFNDKDLYL